MSTLDNSHQFQDDLAQTQAKFLRIKPKTDLKLYQRNSMNKINMRSYLGKNFICSTYDKYRKIRVPITALLLKCLETKNEKNIRRMQKIKRIIYSSTLQEIVNKHAITSQQLLSNFAFNIQQLECQKQNLESLLIKKINSEPFFDKIIMESLFQKFYDPSHQISITCKLSKWIKNQLGISIIFVQNQTQIESDSTIFLRKGEKNESLRQLKSFHVCSMTSIIEDSLQIMTPSKPQNTKVKKLESSSKLLQSISSLESPTVRVSVKLKSDEKLVAISVQNSIQLLSHKQNDWRQDNIQEKQEDIPIKKRKDQTNESRFWKILCCSSQ